MLLVFRMYCAIVLPTAETGIFMVPTVVVLVEQITNDCDVAPLAVNSMLLSSWSLRYKEY